MDLLLVLVSMGHLSHLPNFSWGDVRYPIFLLTVVDHLLCLQRPYVFALLRSRVSLLNRLILLIRWIHYLLLFLVSTNTSAGKHNVCPTRAQYHLQQCSVAPQMVSFVHFGFVSMY